MDYPLIPLHFGDVLERFFGLFGRSFKRLAAIFLIVGIPAAVVMAVSVSAFSSSLIAIISYAGGGRPDEAVLREIFRGISFLGVGIFLLLIADVVVLIVSQLVVCGELVGRRIGVREAFELCSPTRLGRAVGQRLLAEMASGLSIVAPYLLIPAVVAAHAGGAIIALLVLVFILAIGLYIYLRVRWAFGTTTIAWEDETVLGAFTRSGHLVGGNGLRLLGILGLFAILVGIAISMLMLPIQFWAFKDLFLLGLQESARNVALQQTPTPADLLAHLGPVYGFAAGAATLFQTLLKSIYLPILYFDLRARKKEFSGASPIDG